MRQFFMSVKTLFIPQRQTLSVLVLAALTLLNAACEPKNEQTDHTQAMVTEGNSSLERMEQIDRSLRADGILIKHPALSSYVLNRKSEIELNTLRKSVSEYIQHAESVMKIASRPDVRFSDKERIAESLSGANRLLSLIDTELGRTSEIAREQLTAELWAEWRACQKWSRENLSLYGISMRPDLMNDTERSPRSNSVDAGPLKQNLKQNLARLGRQRRLRVNKMAQRHVACLKLEIRMEHVFGRQNEPRSLELLNLKAVLEQMVTDTTPASQP